MIQQYVPKNWPTDCQCPDCHANCGRQRCDGDCQADCQPEYDCQDTVYSVAGGMTPEISKQVDAEIERLGVNNFDGGLQK